MIIQDYYGFGGTWENWCDNKFANDSSNLAKCKAWAPFPPWTDLGALMRGIPKPESVVVSVLQPSAPQPYDKPTEPSVPAPTTAPIQVFTSKWLTIGAALLGGAVLVYAITKPRKKE